MFTVAAIVPQLFVTVYDITDVPNATPVNEPLALPIVTIDVLVLVHTPPEAPSVNVVVPPVTTEVLPDIVPALGNGLTVTTAVAAELPQLLAIV